MSKFRCGCTFSTSFIEIHDFGDASELAMCATLYIRVFQNDECLFNIVLAKTKVAPLKTQTIPRLELCSLLLLAKLVESLVSALHLLEVPVHM